MRGEKDGWIPLNLDGTVHECSSQSKKQQQEAPTMVGSTTTTSDKPRVPKKDEQQLLADIARHVEATDSKVNLLIKLTGRMNHIEK
jgi:hypothetical protein